MAVPVPVPGPVTVLHTRGAPVGIGVFVHRRNADLGFVSGASLLDDVLAGRP